MQNLIMIPGLLCSPRLYEPQVSALGDIADITIADHTRHETMAEVAKAILHDAPQCFALCGLSMGGYIAFEIMRQAGERVTRMALLDTSAGPETPEVTERRRTFMKMAKDGAFSTITRDILMPLLIHENRLEDAALTRTICAMAEEVGPDAFLRQQRAIMSRADSRPGLAKISCPALVIVGEADQLTPSDHAREMADAIPRARLEIIADCGHLSTLEKPDAVNRYLRGWLGDDSPHQQ